MYNTVQVTVICKYINIPSTQIADFGLSRDLIDENYYITSGGMVPVKWTAPEVVKYILYKFIAIRYYSLYVGTTL